MQLIFYASGRYIVHIIWFYFKNSKKVKNIWKSIEFFLILDTGHIDLINVKIFRLDYYVWNLVLIKGVVWMKPFLFCFCFLNVIYIILFI